jgi:predicted nucleic acid-binding protein
VTVFVKGIMLNQNIRVLYSTRALLVQSIDFYEQRADKHYSLTDCMSMLVMRQRHILDVLTTDKHFRQEGFRILMEVV